MQRKEKKATKKTVRFDVDFGVRGMQCMMHKFVRLHLNFQTTSGLFQYSALKSTEVKKNDHAFYVKSMRVAH